jgi:hypothetical protein
MPTFEVDEDLARLIQDLANPAPFENLTFSDGLRRALSRLMKENGAPQVSNSTGLIAALVAGGNQPKKAPSPSARLWAESVPELKRVRGLGNWKAVCDHLKIETGVDSARRKLQVWVRENRPAWPEVPDA